MCQRPLGLALAAHSCCRHCSCKHLSLQAPVWKPDPYAPAKEEPKGTVLMDTKDLEGLEELEDEFDDDRFLEQYRQRRMQELQASASGPRFGSLEEIRRSDFVKQVTNAGEGIWVVCHLYSER